MEQRRATTRSRTLLEGWVLLENRSRRIECTVRDLSASGARLMFSEPGPVPTEFEIQIPKKKLSSHARIVWSDGQLYGIQFVAGPNAAADVRPAAGAASHDAVADIGAILDEAQARIAQVLGVPVDAVRLKLDIDS